MNCHFLWKRNSTQVPFENVTHARTDGRTETERRSCPRARHGAHTAHTSDTHGDKIEIYEAFFSDQSDKKLRVRKKINWPLAAGAPPRPPR